MVLSANTAVPSVRAESLVVRLGPAGPLQPPRQALQPHGEPSSGGHGLGALSPSSNTLRATRPAVPLTAGVTTLPSSYDISQYNPPVGNQGSVNSCVSWVMGYYLRGW